MIRSLEDSFVLRNRVKMPCVGYGTYLEEGKEAYRSVATALRSGYRLIDTASLYKNEKEVGEAVGNFLRAGAAERSDLFITSKLWNADRGYDKTIAAFNKSLETLGLDYLDLYLIHWPANTRQFSPAEAKTLNQETWRALEDLYLSGRVRAIGVSNFLVHHLEDIYETARIEPMVDQIEFHP
ncbi:MAG: aldo/keto reductase, partial [Erysipelotrichaceae bacterium]|nr:aldo/keto reductase [Erysipelotrichaceae bacterium]